MYKELLQKIIQDHPHRYSQVIKRYHESIFNELVLLYPSKKFSESLYRYLHDIDKIPTCISCDNTVTFGSLNTGYIGVYCSYDCMHKGRKNIARETRSCKLCDTSFKTYKKTKRNYCSQECRVVIGQQNAKTRTTNSTASNRKRHGGVHSSSTKEYKDKANATRLLRYGDETFVNPEKSKRTRLERYGSETYNNQEKNYNTKLEKYGDGNYNNRPKFLESCILKYGVGYVMKLQEFQDKAAATKLQRYGEPYYNNKNKSIETCLARYGVKYVCLMTIKSNGRAISKAHQRLFDNIKGIHKDAIIEYQLVDLGLSVDIFIPSKNLIIEFYGDFWHCNPSKYQSDYYQKYLHKTAAEKWELDSIRETKIKDAGYDLKIVWESDFKKKDFNIENIL